MLHNYCYFLQAFRDWGVELFDWQSQCSMRVTPEAFTYTLRRMLPTVGCEADAIAFTQDAEEAASLFRAQPGQLQPGWPADLNDGGRGTLDHALGCHDGGPARAAHRLLWSRSVLLDRVLSRLVGRCWDSL